MGIDDVVAGRVRASRGEGHSINAGLPDELPAWLYQIRQRGSRTPAPARHGLARGVRVGVNWRLTLAQWARQGYADGHFMWARAPRRPSRLVVLWDVSGSMASYVGWYFPWLYRMAHAFNEVGVFGFGTDLADLTEYLRAPYRRAVSMLYRETGLWGSGTAIGEVFERWNQQYGRKWLGTYTTLVIISDGWDVGDPDRLEGALRHMAMRSRHIVWINPLMVTRGFEPRTRALMTALHYTRDMVAGATPEDLTRMAWRWGLV